MRPSCLCVHLYICTRGCEKESDRERNRARRVVRGVTGARGGERLSALSRTASQCVCVCRGEGGRTRGERSGGGRAQLPPLLTSPSVATRLPAREVLWYSRESRFSLSSLALFSLLRVCVRVCVQHSSLHNSVHRQRQHLPRLKIHHLWCATRSL